MKFRALSLIIGAFLMLVGSTRAVTISDTILFPQLAFGVQQEFNITDAGYIPGTPLASASATFLFAGTGTATISLGDQELVVGSDSGLPFSSAMIFTGDSLSDLMADGKIEFIITSGSATLFAVTASLDAVVAGSTPVPDGGATLALLGIGLCGLVGLKRKLGRK